MNPLYFTISCAEILRLCSTRKLKSQIDENLTTPLLQPYGPMGLHGESQSSVRLGDEEDEGSGPNGWDSQGQSPTNFDADSGQGGGSGKSADLTKRIPTPRRPSVPGSAVDFDNNETPAESTTGNVVSFVFWQCCDTIGRLYTEILLGL